MSESQNYPLGYSEQEARRLADQGGQPQTEMSGCVHARNRCETSSRRRMSPVQNATIVSGLDLRSHNSRWINEPRSSFSITSVTPARRQRRGSIVQP
jgi:hypothetical protein